MKSLTGLAALISLSTWPALAITPEVATHVLIFGNMAFSLTESEGSYRVEGTTQAGNGPTVPFVMTMEKDQGCIVAIETVTGSDQPGAEPSEVRTTDWTKVLVDQIRVTSRPAPEGGADASHRTILIPARDRFTCVRVREAPRGGDSARFEERCTDQLRIEGAHLLGHPSIHDLQKQALTAVLELCAGQRPNLEPHADPP